MAMEKFAKTQIDDLEHNNSRERFFNELDSISMTLITRSFWKLDQAQVDSPTLF